MRKIIQIAFEPESTNSYGETSSVMWALSNDGRLYYFNEHSNSWIYATDASQLPQDNTDSLYEKKSKMTCDHAYESKTDSSGEGVYVQTWDYQECSKCGDRK